MKSLFCLIALLTAGGAFAEMPFYMIRLRDGETDDPKVWAETLQALVDNPGCCDEVWFSTGISYPPLAVHRERAAKQAKAAEDLRKIGILPGLQIQATLGHADEITLAGGDSRAKDWTGWTGSQGVEDKLCSCPRDPKFIAYFEEVGRIYGAYQPSSIWIDDDLRISNHRPATNKSLDGCWCARCIGDFEKESGIAGSREDLAKRVAADAGLKAKWDAFQFGSLATLAGRIAKAVAEVSPQTRMAYQHAGRADGLQRKIFEAMSQANGLSVFSRPGGGAYFDHDPHVQIVKAFMMMRQRESLRNVSCIDGFCPEIETCPRAFACRTPRGVLLECLENLALGMDALSMLITDSRYERMSWYGNTFFKALSENRACLRSLRRTTSGCRPVGLLIEGKGDWNDFKWPELCAGIPVITGCGHAVGKMSDFVKADGGRRLNLTSANTRQILAASRLADKIAGGKLPVVLESPFVGCVMPQAEEDGTVKAITVINTTIGRTAPTTLKVRGVAKTAKKAVWWALDAHPVDLAISRKGADVLVTVPPIEGWCGGWIGFEADETKDVMMSKIGGFGVDSPAIEVEPLLFLKQWRQTAPGGRFSFKKGRQGSLVATYVRTNAEDIAIELLALTFKIPAKDWNRVRLVADGKHVKLPPVFDQMAVAGGRISRFDVESLEDRAQFSFAFDRPVGFFIQDNRKFGSSEFEVRFLISNSGTLAKGSVQRFETTISGDCKLVPAAAKLITITRGPEWIPIVGGGDVTAGTALDFTDVIPSDKPAGCHGRVLAKGDHFVFADSPDVPRRFYGVNLCMAANFVDHETAKALAKRLRRVGYNAVRFHHHDGGLASGSADGTTINPKMLDRFDGLLAACAAEGIYVTTDLYVSRPVPWKSLGVNKPGTVPMDQFKALVRTNAVAQANLKTFVRQWLTHVNPYTGRRWADEPALAWISLVNENNIGNHGDPQTAETLETEVVFAREMKRFLRDEIGCQALITDMNGWATTKFHQKPRKEVYDYVDNHFYVDHPHFIDKPWQLPSRCPNTNPICNPNCGRGAVDAVRVEGKPFVITEYNYSGPGRFRGVGGIATGAAGASLDWAGLWRFAWSHSKEPIERPGCGHMGYFDIASDPLALASERASETLFLRGDLPVGKQPHVDRASGSFILETPKTAGGFAEGGRISAGDLKVTLSGPATVWASSLDNRPLAESAHVLVSHLTDVQNEGIVYADRKLRVLTSWGHLPCLMRRGTADVFLAGKTDAVKVYALSADGKRRGEVPTRVQDGRLCFRCDVARDPNEATFVYEVVR